MRIKSTTFGVRKQVNTSDEPIKKYFLSYEGVQTEVLYFDGVNQNKEKLKIDSSIQFIPLLRHFAHIGWSNPLKIIERVLACLNNLSKNERNVDSLVQSICDYYIDACQLKNIKADRDELYRQILHHFVNEFNLSRDDSISLKDVNLIDNISSFLESFNNIYVVENINSFIESQFETYDKSYDKVCLIVDRDKKSFTTSQYMKLLRICEKNNIKLYVSNPCFEFWLLLHFDKVLKLDPIKLSDNSKEYKIINNFGNEELITFAEYELRKSLPHYKKNNLNFNDFIERVPKAISNSKNFETDIVNLQHCIGSNIGKLFEELQKV